MTDPSSSASNPRTSTTDDPGAPLHDPPITSPDDVLERQRAEHEGDGVQLDDEGVGALVNNTGLDGGAATG